MLSTVVGGRLPAAHEQAARVQTQPQVGAARATPLTGRNRLQEDHGNEDG
jgi:hypothetical protein